MEFIKHLIGTEIVYYPKLESVIDKNNYFLLGFKDSLPVLSSKMDSSSNKDKIITKTVTVGTNSLTGEKFIMLKGKKIKILAESELPKNSQIVKISSSSNLPPQTMKFKVLKGSNHPILLPQSVDNKITSEIKRKSHLIGSKLQKIPISKAEHTIADKSGIDADNTKMVKTENIGGKHIILNKLLNTSNHQSVQSAALDLSTYVMKEDKGVQVTFDSCDKDTQVDMSPKQCQIDLDRYFDDLFSSSDLSDFLGVSSPQKCLDSDSDLINSQDFSLPHPVIPEKTRKMQEKFLKELKATLQVDDKGNMPIHTGVVKNDLKLVKRSCFMLNIHKKSVDIPNNNDLTPLQLAIINNSSIEIISFLLQKGAQIEEIDSEGNNLLHYAVQYERTEALGVMLRYINQQNFNLNLHNHEGLTPLMICCLNRLHDCGEILLECEADPNVRDQISGRTALFHAAEVHDVGMVEMLLQFNADTKIKNFFGTSPHDAMYEIDDMPEQIKYMILGKNNKRKNGEEPRPMKYSKKLEMSRAGLKTYARMEKIQLTEMKNFKRIK